MSGAGKRRGELSQKRYLTTRTSTLFFLSTCETWNIIDLTVVRYPDRVSQVPEPEMKKCLPLSVTYAAVLVSACNLPSFLFWSEIPINLNRFGAFFAFYNAYLKTGVFSWTTEATGDTIFSTFMEKFKLTEVSQYEMGDAPSAWFSHLRPFSGLRCTHSGHHRLSISMSLSDWSVCFIHFCLYLQLLIYRFVNFHYILLTSMIQ